MSPRHHPPAGFAADMAASMDRMMDAMHVDASGDPDRDFLAMMIPHHQGAIDMAAAVLRHGRDPLVRQLAEEIIAGQRVEIASMQARLAVHEGHAPDEAYPALGGTRGPS
jgi:uncharacterized protein (DUF305 family)